MEEPPAAPVRRAPVLDPPLPRALQVEVTGACNLRCKMCLVRYRPPIDRVSGSLSVEEVVALLDALPGLEQLTLQGLGEPLLAPGLVEMVHAAASRGVRVGFNTNATVLTESKGEALIGAGLSWLCVSLDGATPETFEDIRVGARFGRVVENLRRFAATKRRVAAPNPDLSVVFVAMRRNVLELPAVVDLVADCGVSTLRVQNLSHTFDDCDPSGEYVEIRSFARREALWGPSPAVDAKAAFEEALEVAAERGVELRLPELESPGPEIAAGCGWPWREAYVAHDGTVQPCCMVMGSDRASLGNIREEPFEAIWHGQAYQRFRAGLTGEAPVPAVCTGCSLYQGVF